MNTDIVDQIQTALDNAKSVNMTPQRIVASIIIAAIAAAILIVSRILIRRVREKSQNTKFASENTAFSAMATFGQFFVVIVAFLVILNVNGVNVNAWVAVVGLFGAAIGLAIQDVVKDIIMGLRIVGDDFFKVGDVIKIDGHVGVVLFMNLRTTRIEDIEDHSIYSICNRELIKVEKVSSQVDINLQLSYELPMDVAYKLLKKICMEIGQQNEIEACIFKGTQGFGEYAVTYKIRFYCDPSDRPDLSRLAHRIIQKKLAEADVRIPYRRIVVEGPESDRNEHI